VTVDWKILLTRPELPPLPPGAPSPADIAYLQLDQAVDAMERWLALDEVDLPALLEPSTPACDAAYDLLAAWKGLQRLRPEHCDDLPRILQRLASIVRQDGGPLARAAAQVPCPEAWLEAAKTLEAGPAEPAAQLSPAVDLLDQLDRVELVRCALSELAAQGYAAEAAAETLEDQLLPCLEWLQENSRAFLPAEVAVRSLAAACRHDLDETDPELAMTLDKLVGLLDTIELRWSPPAISAAQAARWLQDLRAHPSLRERLRTAARELSSQLRGALHVALDLPAYAPLDATASGPPAPEPELLEWRGIQPWSALLRLPPPNEAHDENEVLLRVFDAPAAATQAMLLGIPATLLPQAEHCVARYRMGELRAAQQSQEHVVTLALFCQDSGELWLARHAAPPVTRS